MNVVTVEDLTKSYRSGWRAVHALSGLTLSIGKGEIYGFLGPNGAGKTTTIKILMGLLRSTSGKAEIFLEKLQGMYRRERGLDFFLSLPIFMNTSRQKSSSCFTVIWPDWIEESSAPGSLNC